VLLLGLPPSIVILAYAVLRRGLLSSGYLLSLASVVVVLNAAPYLVWYYDQVLFPTFGEGFAGLAGDADQFKRTGEKYQKLYTDWWPVASGLAAVPIPLLIVGGQEFITAKGLFGVTDPLFWLVGLVLIWLGVIVGLGFLLVVTTLLVIRDVASDELRIDPLHPDGLGGLSVAGYYAIRTTGLFSIGALLLPLQLQYAAVVGGPATALVYVMATVYATFIAASFLYPTVLLNRRADEIRQRILDTLRKQYHTIKIEGDEPEIGGTTTAHDPALEAKLQRIRKEYEDYRQLRLYPMNGTILVRLLGSILLPLAFIVIDSLLQPSVITDLLGLIL